MTNAKIVCLMDEGQPNYFVYVGFDHKCDFRWHKWPVMSCVLYDDAREFCERNNLNVCAPVNTYNVTGSRRYCPNNGVVPLL